MSALGVHVLLELADCDKKMLNNPRRIKEILVEAARRARVTIVKTTIHKFNPYGVSGVVVIAESHISIHTWPEHGCAAVDIFTCGKGLEPDLAAEFIIKEFCAQKYRMDKIPRITDGFLLP